MSHIQRHWSAQREGSSLLRLLTLLWLIVHLASLAASQTVYGTAFFSLRWISLVALTIVGGAWWLLQKRKAVRLDFVKLRVSIYLAAWTVTVLASEHPLFSGYRLAAHGMVILPALIFLPEALRSRDYAFVILTLKVITAAVLILSYFQPATLTVFDHKDWFRGILGNANSLGHMAAVGVVLFAHGHFSVPSRVQRILHAVMAVLAFALLVDSHARSSFIAAFAGLAVLMYYYRQRISGYVTSAVGFVSLALIALPSLSSEIAQRVFKHDVAVDSESALQSFAWSRVIIFERNIEGFLQRPWTGRGFGVDADTNLVAWSGEFRSTGFTGRDPVGDAFYTLETGGVIGFLAYFFLVALLLRARRPKSEPSVFGFQETRTILGRQMRKQMHIGYFATACTMAALLQLDGTALAAGNFFAALMWMSLGASIALSVGLKSDVRSVRFGMIPFPSGMIHHRRHL